MQIFHGKMLLEECTLFQQHFSVKYLHRKPIGFNLLQLIYAKKVLLLHYDLGYKGLISLEILCQDNFWCLFGKYVSINQTGIQRTGDETVKAVFRGRFFVCGIPNHFEGGLLFATP